jgi:hypothetical protein
LVVHSHPTPIPPLSTWTNNVRDSGENVVGPNFFNNIIGPSRRRWDRSGIRVYNQAFLLNFKSFRVREMLGCTLSSHSYPTFTYLDQ